MVHFENDFVFFRFNQRSITLPLLRKNWFGHECLCAPFLCHFFWAHPSSNRKMPPSIFGWLTLWLLAIVNSNRNNNNNENQSQLCKLFMHTMTFHVKQLSLRLQIYHCGISFSTINVVCLAAATAAINAIKNLYKDKSIIECCLFNSDVFFFCWIALTTAIGCILVPLFPHSQQNSEFKDNSKRKKLKINTLRYCCVFHWISWFWISGNTNTCERIHLSNENKH